MPARELAPLLELRDIEFHLLQSEIRAADRDYLAGLPNVRLHTDDLTDLCETGALAMHMDCIVTVCTAMAHLSGRLALPTCDPAVDARALAVAVRAVRTRPGTRPRGCSGSRRSTPGRTVAEAVAAAMLRQRFPVGGG